MPFLKWSASHAVFVTDIDDEHKEIFDAVSSLQTAFANGDASADIRKLTEHLVACIVGHFAHEERLMRAARYSAIRWHQQQHEHARRRVGQLVRRIERGDAKAGPALVEYLKSWLQDHTRLADRMLGAALRNHQRGLCKVTFRAGTKPMDACAWVDVNGDRLDSARQ